MSMVGTFDSFTTARLGIYAAQHGLRVTGNNISNINTAGYTRQRIDQVSLKSGGADMYRSPYDNHVGNGALVTGINQVRDPYLDIQYRNTAPKVGYTDTWLSGLQDIARTLDEVGKGLDTNKSEEGDGILYAQLQDLRDMLLQLHNNPTKENDTLVRKSAETLCQLFNSYASNLETLRKNLDDNFSKELNSVNEILTNIRDLNETIRNAEIVGDNALELRDERNRQIDALSEYMQIKVEYVMEDIGGGKQVEKLIISLGNANPDPEIHTDETRLIDGVYGAKLLYPETLKVKDADGNITEVKNTNYTIQVSNLVDSKNVLPKNHNEVNVGRPITLQDNDLYGSFQAMRELLTEKGEFATQADIDADPNASIKRGIPYYQMSLDLLARKFAETYNELNQGIMRDQDGNPIETDTVEQIVPTLAEINGKVYAWNETKMEYEEKPGWTLEDVNGVKYAVEATGSKKYFAGLHGAGCNIYQKIPFGEGTEAILGGLEKVANDTADANMAAAAAEIRQAAGAAADGFEDPDVKDKVYALLADTLADHGVDNNDTTKAQVPVPVGGPLFSNRNDGDDTTDITAANISVSHSWSEGDVQVVPTFTLLFDGTIKDSTQNTNIDHMISKIDEALVYNPQDLDPDAVSTKLFEGSFNDMFSSMAATVGYDQRTQNTLLNNNYSELVDIDTRRDGVSGVDLNDEAMNMMQYQKAYSAACRLMTVIDSVLDRLINNTGITV